MKYPFLIGALFLSPVAILAQTTTTTPAQSPAPATVLSPSKEIGVFVFGRNGQSSDKQLKDESECYAAAKQHSGIDPDAPAPIGMAAEQKKPGQKATSKSTEPTGGAAHTSSAQHQDSAAAKKETAAKLAAEQKSQEERAKLAHLEGLDPFQRAFSACMDSRNYSVK